MSQDRMIIAGLPILGLIVMPFFWLPGSVFALVMLSLSVWLLAKDKLLETRLKLIIVLAWLSSIGCLIYSFFAFSEKIEAADLDMPEPAWTNGLGLAVVLGLILLALPVFLLLRASHEKPLAVNQ